MQFKIILLSLISIFSFYTLAQDSKIQNTTSHKGEPTVKSALLWRISGKKVKTPCYLFGTMHLMPEKSFYFPESLKNYFKTTDVLVMEIADLSNKAKAMKLLMLDTGTVWNFFTKAQQDSIFTYAEDSLGYTENKMRLYFSKFKPIVLLQLLTKKGLGEKIKSYEMTFTKMAKQDSMEIKGLETIEEQVGFITSLDTKKQVEAVMAAIRPKKQKNNTTEDLVKIYLSQDIEAIRAFVTKSDLDSPTFENNLINNRNKSWIKPIQKIIKSNSAFIAVGAAHLGGKNGVVNLLKEKGYILTPIKL